jgi:hypothetical protein
MKASPVVRIKLRVRLPDATRPYLNPVFSANKKLKPGYALVDGKRPSTSPTAITTSDT